MSEQEESEEQENQEESEEQEESLEFEDNFIDESEDFSESILDFDSHASAPVLESESSFAQPSTNLEDEMQAIPSPQSTDQEESGGFSYESDKGPAYESNYSGGAYDSVAQQESEQRRDQQVDIIQAREMHTAPAQGIQELNMGQWQTSHSEEPTMHSRERDYSPTGRFEKKQSTRRGFRREE